MSLNKHCHIITDFPQPYSESITPYPEKEFSSCVKKFCLSHSSISSGLRMCKVIVLGDVSVGKTSIVNRFCRQIFNFNYKATIGVDFEMEQFEILNIPFNIQIWDTAGQERFRCIASAYYRSAHAVVTVFDLTNIKSLHHCVVWMNEAVTSNIETPLKFLVGSKLDLLTNETYVQVEQQAARIAKIMGSEYWSVSARTGKRVNELFNRIAGLSFDRIINLELKNPDNQSLIKLGQNLPDLLTEVVENMNDVCIDFLKLSKVLLSNYNHPSEKVVKMEINASLTNLDFESERNPATLATKTQRFPNLADRVLCNTPHLPTQCSSV